MKKIISILLTASVLAGSAAMPFTAIAAETIPTTSQASEAAKTGTLTVTVYNEDEGGLYTDERTSFMITGSPDQTMSYGMGGSTFLCSVKPSESNPFVLNDIDIISNTNYTIIDSGSPDYDGFNYRIDYERSDRTFKFTENPNQDLSIYMKKNYFVVNSDKSVTVATHGQDIFDNMQAVMSQTLELINSDDFKALATADRISKAKELMKSLSDEALIADYAFDAEKNVMKFTYKCGTITGQLRPAVFEDEHKQLETTEIVAGDTNCDGTMDLADAIMIMQALANPDKYGINGTAERHLTEQGKLNGDMNGDGLTVGDALAIQRKLLGLDEETDSDIVVFEMTPSKTSVDEFLANNPTIKSSYKDDELFNITPQEITDKYGFKIFKYSEECETYLEYQGKVYQLGTGWGGPGTVSFAVADLNEDEHYELYYTYSWGSGLNYAVLDCFDITSSIKFEGFDQLDYSLTDNFALAAENGKLGVYKAKLTSSGFVDIKAEPTVKLGEIIADNEKNKVVFVPVNKSDIGTYYINTF